MWGLVPSNGVHWSLRFVVLFAFAMGCSAPADVRDGTEDETTGDTRQALAASRAQPLIPESPSPRAVSVTWGDAVSGRLAIVRGALPAVVRNQRSAPLTVLVVAVGGSPSPVVSTLGEFALAANETRALSIPFEKLPVQSVGAPTAIQLFGYAEVDGTENRIPSPSLMVAFSSDYGTAYTSGIDSYGPLVASEAGGDLEDPRVKSLLAGGGLASGRLSLSALRARLQKSSVRVRDDATGAFHAPSASSSAIEPVSVTETPIAKASSGTLGPPLLLPPEHLEELRRESELEARAAAAPANVSELADTGATPGVTVENVGPRASTTIPVSGRVRVCARYDVQYTDSARGEDYMTGGFWYSPLPSGNPLWISLPTPARYAYYQIAGRSGYLDADGCVSLSSMPTGSHLMTVYSKLRRGTTNYDVLELQPKDPDWNCPVSPLRGRYECELSGKFVQFVSVRLVPFGSSAPTVYITSGAATPTFRVAAVAGQVLWTTDSGLKANDTYKVYSNSGCPSMSWREACAGTDAYFGIGIGTPALDTTLEKFVIAHELGHQIQWHQGASKSSSYVADPSSPSSCRCDHVTSANALHCLQSRHDWSTAQAEGWAHFVSQRTFNALDSNNCTFVYYKEVREDPGIVRSPPYVVNCGAPVRWLENHCDRSGHSVEWDILTFLRGINATSSPNALSMDEIFTIYRGTPSSITWSSFEASAFATFGSNLNEPKFVRVLDSGRDSGVNR